MNTLPDTLSCLECGGIVETAMIVAHPSEFMLEDKELKCPFCDSGILRDTSTLNTPKPNALDQSIDQLRRFVLGDDCPMPEAFAEFIEGLQI